MARSLVTEAPPGQAPAPAPASGIPASHPRPKLNLQRREAIAGYLFLLPNIIGFVLFTVLAVAASAVLSLTDWDLLSAPNFVGLENYRTLLFDDPLFKTVLWNTFYFTVVGVPASIVIALGLALALNTGIRALPWFRAAYFLPVITATVVVALIWRWFFNPDFGVLNYILYQIGIETPPNWLGDRTWAMPAVIIVAVWKQIGYNMVIFLAGLQAVPHTLYEAAATDGAGRWQRFWHITLPLLTPTTFFIVIISIIGSLQAFDSIRVMTDGGPANATRTIVYHIWQQAFQFLEMGYAAAVSWMLFIAIFAFTLIQWQLQKRWVHYEA